MAVRQVRTCDKCGAEDAAQHIVAYDGIFTSIDLCPKDEKTLEQALGAYLDSGTEISAAEARKLTSGNGHEVDPSAVRAWAAAQTPPIKVGLKGRIPADIVEKYLAATKPAEAE
jgi:hypothetical protein